MIIAAWGQDGPGALPIIDGAMTVQTDSGHSAKTALHEAEMEIRHLHGTIAALRQELEEQRSAKDQAVQQASADAQGEIKQLRDTVRALRDELESLQHSKQDAVQKANADSAGEIGDLRRTAAVLRDQMESLKRDCDDRLGALWRAQPAHAGAR